MKRDEGGAYMEVGQLGGDVVVDRPDLKNGVDIWRTRFSPAQARAFAEALVLTADEIERHPAACANCDGRDDSVEIDALDECAYAICKRCGAKALVR